MVKEKYAAITANQSIDQNLASAAVLFLSTMGCDR
jgi:hypothetical protein